MTFQYPLYPRSCLKRCDRLSNEIGLSGKRTHEVRFLSLDPAHYTMRELELCLGEDHQKIATWIRNGWLQDRLQGTRRHDGNGNDIHRIQEKDILNFVRNHPQEINLGKVDQTWFLDFVLLKGWDAARPRSIDAAEGVEAA